MDLVVYVNSISIKPEGEKKNIDEQPVEETHRAKSGRGKQSLHALYEHTTLPAPPLHPESPSNLFSDGLL